MAHVLHSKGDHPYNWRATIPRNGGRPQSRSRAAPRNGGGHPYNPCCQYSITYFTAAFMYLPAVCTRTPPEEGRWSCGQRRIVVPDGDLETPERRPVRLLQQASTCGRLPMRPAFGVDSCSAAICRSIAHHHQALRVRASRAER